MKFRNRLCTTVWGVLFVSLLVLGSSSARLKSSQKAWGEVVNGLEMTIHLNQAELVQLKTPKFRVELRNAGESDLVLNVGVMLANGQKQYPNAVVLTLTDAQGNLGGLVSASPRPLLEEWIHSFCLSRLAPPFPSLWSWTNTGRRPLRNSTTS
jgi:hypothetical protein